MSIEAMKLARSVISSINQGKQHALTVNDETVFWQREEWVRWALDEVLPAIDQAIEQAEKQEPVAWFHTATNQAFTSEPPPSLKAQCKVLVFADAAPPQRQPLADAVLERLYDAHAKYQEYGAWVSGWFEFARAIEAAHGIKGEA